MSLTYVGKPAAHDPGYGGEPLFTYDQCKTMNIAFAYAMLDARAAGLERFTIGPVKDRSAFFPTHFEIAPTLSLMTSSAAAIVDAPEPQAMPTRFMPSLAPTPGYAKRAR